MKSIAQPQKTLVRTTAKVMKGGKVISEKIIYEKPKEIEVVPAPVPPPPIKTPITPPPLSPTAARPEFMEPLVSPTKMNEFRKAWLEDMKKNEAEFLAWEASQPGTWIREIDRLEREREPYNKKRSWTAKDLAAVEKIDQKIKACEEILGRMEEEAYYEDSE